MACDSRTQGVIHRKCSSAESQDMNQFWQERKIRITVEKLENFDCDDFAKLGLQIKFMGNIMTECFISLDENGCAETDLSAFIVINRPDPRMLDDILANPVIFALFESPLSNENESTPLLSTKSKSMAKSSVSEKLKNLGLCNMDISALLTGHKNLRESLIIENDQKSVGHRATSWPKLPRLIVTAATDVDEVILESVNLFNNTISVTVESVYNAPITVPEGTMFDANFPIPCFGDGMENVVFTKGISTFSKESESTKQWSTLPNIEGRGNLTKFKIHYEISDVFNPLPGLINLQEVFRGDSYKIMWNKWRRCIITKTGFNIFIDKIKKYRAWPIEITATTLDKIEGIGKTGKQEKKVKTAASVTAADTRHYVAFLDLTSLLYPGTTRVRVAAQLCTYSADEMSKWEKKSSKIDVHSCSRTSMPITKSKGASRSKTCIFKGKPCEELQEELGTPLFDDKGQAVFIIVEVEIWKPYIPKKSPEFLHESLISYIPPKGKTPRKKMTCALADDNFVQAIETFSFIIQEEYRNFLTEHKEYLPEAGEIYFYDYLCRTPNFQKVKLTLENQALKLIAEKLGNFESAKDAIPDVYVTLVDKMHKAIKNCSIEQTPTILIDMDQFQLFAEEAIEEGNFKRAKRFLLQKIEKYKNNPDYWLDYAEFSLKTGEMEKAIESIREALSWDLGHQMGLVMYGLSMATVQDYCVSETVFLALLSKYPDFIQGWIIISLFYLKIENYEGVQVALHTAAKLQHRRNCEEIQDISSEGSLPEHDSATSFEKTCNTLAEGKYGIESYVKGASSTDSLAWTTSLCPESSLFIQTAVLLLKIGFYEYAELALAQELLLENCGRSLPYLYYTAVSFYYKGRYQEALSHLEEAVKSIDKDCHVWALMGHCYQKLKDCSKAIACYEYVIESSNRPDDIYLIYSRMCDYYLRAKKLNCVKKLGMAACKYKSTPKILTLIGIACYDLMEFEEAETFFREANFLDSFCPVIWGYLALVNIQLGRYEVFNQCYLEAKKKNLQDELLIEEIEKLRQLKGFPEKPWF